MRRIEVEAAFAPRDPEIGQYSIPVQEYAALLAEPPIEIVEMLRAGRYLARWTIWNRDKLASELFAKIDKLTTREGTRFLGRATHAGR